MGKYALFAFTGEATCFVHVLLNGLDAAQAQGLVIREDMSGHAGMARYLLESYSIITF